MTAQRRSAASRADTTIAPCQWLIPDQAARREILLGFFRMYVEHAMADGLVDTTAGRTAAAPWIPVGPGGPGQPGGHDERLAEVTGQWAERFVSFDQELDARHLTGGPLMYPTVRQPRATGNR